MFSFHKPCPCKDRYQLIVLKNGKEIDRQYLLPGDEAIRIMIEHNEKCPDRPLETAVVMQKGGRGRIL